MCLSNRACFSDRGLCSDGKALAALYAYAAAAADLSATGDPRTAETRQRQVEGCLRQAAELCPADALPLSALTGLDQTE